jgi:hypothetical protein
MMPCKGMGSMNPAKIPSAGSKKPVVFKDGGWIQKAIKKPGALRKELGVKAGEKIPAKELTAAAKAPGKLGQRARLAKTLRGMA